MYVGFALSAVAFYLSGAALVDTGMWGLLFPGMLLLSPIMMALLRFGFEGPLGLRFFDPHAMSWAFVIGDCIVLPFMLWFAGRGWQAVDISDAQVLWSTLLCALAGLVAMIVFRKIDGDRYHRVDWSSSLKSPTKVWHDCVVLPVVVALTLWLLVPQFVMNVTADTVFAVVCLGVFAALVGIDFVYEPDPRKQHYRWDAARFEPVGDI